MMPNDPRNPYPYGPPQQPQQQPYPYPYPNPHPYYPPPVAYAPPSNDSDATMIFVLGILGITACGICAPIAWIKGGTYRTTCQIMGTPPNGLATAGWIMGIIGTVLMGLSILLVLAAFILGA